MCTNPSLKLIDHFRYLKIQLGKFTAMITLHFQNSAWQRGVEDTKQRKLNEHVYSFLLLVSSKPHYQAEF